MMGGYIGLDVWRTRHWYPALEAAGIGKRGPYHLRHSFATEALAAGTPLWELARFMGASAKTIDDTYGHLARDSEQRFAPGLRREPTILASMWRRAASPATTTNGANPLYDWLCGRWAVLGSNQ
jgi:hypothetical protein